eukprot:CAMPEP_0182563036 /NCGR_PEP_ID=MMETSP1324-20130603/5270_1 /TAXON_ID=236786 /ORGANISM="Florenciella sp., Strain RCC1587" /LENGTH=30 /DNA_ID= /DNA_START= /DNA_END= /DNA_ORIENTATION=
MMRSAPPSEGHGRGCTVPYLWDGGADDIVD